MEITRKDFLDRVVAIVFRDQCSHIRAIRVAGQELGLTTEQFLQL